MGNTRVISVQDSCTVLREYSRLGHPEHSTNSWMWLLMWKTALNSMLPYPNVIMCVFYSCRRIIFEAGSPWLSVSTCRISHIDFLAFYRWTIIATMSNRKGDGVNKEEEAFRIKERRALRKLYPSLPTIEISVYTAIWIIGVGYSIYNVYLASRRKYIHHHCWKCWLYNGVT